MCRPREWARPDRRARAAARSGPSPTPTRTRWLPRRPRAQPSCRTSPRRASPRGESWGSENRTLSWSRGYVRLGSPRPGAGVCGRAWLRSRRWRRASSRTPTPVTKPCRTQTTWAMRSYSSALQYPDGAVPQNVGLPNKSRRFGGRDEHLRAAPAEIPTRSRRRTRRRTTSCACARSPARTSRARSRPRRRESSRRETTNAFSSGSSSSSSRGTVRCARAPCPCRARRRNTS